MVVFFSFQMIRFNPWSFIYCLALRRHSHSQPSRCQTSRNPINTRAPMNESDQCQFHRHTQQESIRWSHAAAAAAAVGGGAGEGVTPHAPTDLRPLSLYVVTSSVKREVKRQNRATGAVCLGSEVRIGTMLWLRERKPLGEADGMSVVRAAAVANSCGQKRRSEQANEWTLHSALRFKRNVHLCMQRSTRVRRKKKGAFYSVADLHSSYSV